MASAAGLNAYEFALADGDRLKSLATKLGSPLADVEKRVDSMIAQQKELEKQLDSLRKKQAAATAGALRADAQIIHGTPSIFAHFPGTSGDELQAIVDALKNQFSGVTLLAGTLSDQVALVATVSPEFTGKFQAGKIIQSVAPIVGGKGGGRPDTARGAGKETGKVHEALAQGKALLG